MGRILTASLICLVGGYLLGSVSFSIMVSKLFKGEDIRDFGSKNAGMTNILRTYGKKYALICGLGDFAKGFLAVVLGRLVFLGLAVSGFDPGYVAGAGVVLGHMFPLYFGFRGGKGVLTGMGVIVAISPITVLVVLAVALPLLYFTRIVSMASVVGALLYPVVSFFVHRLRSQPFVLDMIFALIFSSVILYMHRANIKRLISGTEYRFGQKPKE